MSSTTEPNLNPNDLSLSLDIYENEHHLIIIAPIAGIKEEQIDLTITDDVLTISGNRPSPYDYINDQILIQECCWGNFSRAIILPTNIDTTKISATFKNSVLIVKIPKHEKHKTKTVKIKNSN